MTKAFNCDFWFSFDILRELFCAKHGYYLNYLCILHRNPPEIILFSLFVPFHNEYSQPSFRLWIIAQRNLWLNIQMIFYFSFSSLESQQKSSHATPSCFTKFWLLRLWSSSLIRLIAKNLIHKVLTKIFSILENFSRFHFHQFPCSFNLRLNSISLCSFKTTQNGNHGKVLTALWIWNFTLVLFTRTWQR